MTEPTIPLRKADFEDLDRIEGLLEANDLPYRDVLTKPEWFFVAADGTEVVGVGGVEPYGPNGLLRSVVITESRRGQGYGASLVDALEDRARRSGVKTLYLLTTTASAFFRRCGYDAVEREAVPRRIRRTTEFAELCPASAICMKKRL